MNSITFMEEDGNTQTYVNVSEKYFPLLFKSIPLFFAEQSRFVPNEILMVFLGMNKRKYSRDMMRRFLAQVNAHNDVYDNTVFKILSIYFGGDDSDMFQDEMVSKRSEFFTLVGDKKYGKAIDIMESARSFKFFKLID